MSQLLELAERCEKATEDSRLIDGDIALAIGWGGVSSTGLKWADTYPSCREDWSENKTPFNNWKVPHYTASIDAAMTLVPEGFYWKCGYSKHVPHVADLTDYKNHTGRYDGNSDHSRALALCAASLRARAMP